MKDERGSHLAVVLQDHGSKLDLSVGFQHRHQQLPRRTATLLVPFTDGGDPPVRLGLPPWTFTDQDLAEALPPRRDFAAAWLLLADGDQAWALPEWVELVCSRSDPAALAACWLWLHGSQLLFRLRHQGISARSPDDLRRLRREQHRLALDQRSQRQWHEALRRREPLRRSSLGPQQERELDLLLAVAAGQDATDLPVPLRRALQAAHCPADSGGVRHLLVDLGQWDPHHLPSLHATTWETGFSAELEAEAQRLIAQASEARPGDDDRLDLTAQHCVTIDDADTRDIDDALGLERCPDGALRLWIHIADPGRLVAVDSPLDLEARRRGSSLYLASGTLPMFPEALATGPLSLGAGRRNAAWSLAVVLDPEGAVTTFRLVRSWVRPTYRLSYADADELIDLAPPEDPDLADLHALLNRRRRWRTARGAILMDQPEGRIRVRDGQPELELTEPSAARLMVAEAMILAGAVVAAYGEEHHLALPYRSQMPAELPRPAELEALPAGPVRHAAIKRCLSRGHTGATPRAHFTLGLPAYVQATSPIRRYGDLVAQRQLLALQQGQTPLDADALQALLQEIEDPIRQGLQISREDQRHWQQEWFSRQGACQWQGQFLRWLRAQDQLGLVHLEELAMDLAALCPAGSEPGDALIVRVQLVDPLRDQLRLIASS
ncbi:ribonuclease catalytic domain-containing protein [Cyanobium sp. NIES-981]|uniref:ribonuclease catalytic domain-containing protein n=1 Tax=Cyanobium sp. NIES-981 TaxID=1851505 RepID=UPI0007DE0A81|nr:ribonuclease catalytic domain-containing protein [Cyanobium sp. NIES-981]SBO42296.1 Exoribonuclease, VacB/RNB family protein [Cyanobium sp. NIES-981]